MVRARAVPKTGAGAKRRCACRRSSVPACRSAAGGRASRACPHVRLHGSGAQGTESCRSRCCTMPANCVDARAVCVVHPRPCGPYALPCCSEAGVVGNWECHARLPAGQAQDAPLPTTRPKGGMRPASAAHMSACAIAASHDDSKHFQNSSMHTSVGPSACTAPQRPLHTCCRVHGCEKHTTGLLVSALPAATSTGRTQAHLAHGRQHDARQVLREAADDVRHLPHALGIAHGRATELVNHVDLQRGSATGAVCIFLHTHGAGGRGLCNPAAASVHESVCIFSVARVHTGA